MKWTGFEKYYKKKVSNHSSDLDTEALWDILEPQLEKPKKNRRFIFWVWGFGMLMFGSFVGYQFLKTETLHIEAVAVVEGNKVASLDDSKEIQIPTEPKEPFQKNRSTTNTEITKNETLYSSIENHAIENEPSKLTKEITILSAQSFSNPSTLVVEPNKKGNIENVALESNVPISLLLPLGLKSSGFLNVELQEHFDLPKIEVLKPKKKGHWFLSANFGYAKPYRSMFSNTDDAEPFLQKRKDSETGLEVLSSGIEIEYRNQKNWMLVFGISGNQLTERFDFENEFSVTGNITDTTEIIYRENGDILASQGSVVETTDIYQLRKVYNTFRWLETKMGGGYVRQLRRFEIGISGGVLVGFGIKTNGTILDENTGYLDLSQNDLLAYKTNYVWGLFSDLRLQYRLSPKWVISTDLEFKNYQNSFTHRKYPLVIKYRTEGLKIGVQYQFR